MTIAEEIFVINSETRTISIPPKGLLFGVESDNNSERKYFRCPKIVGDNIDLSTFSLRINYKNANNEKDQYIIDDVTEDSDFITFSWLLSEKVTRYKGYVKFILCAVKTRQDGIIINEWNTTLAVGEVIDGMETAGSFLEQPEQDVIGQLLLKMEGAEKAYNDAADLTEKVIDTEKSRESAETNRVDEEKSRVIAETARETAEEERVIDEKDRVENETGRVDEETKRVTSEKARATAETARVKEFSTLKTESQTATTAANTAAQKAESYVLGDISDKSVTFSQASTDTDIASGDKTSTLFGKILKRFNTIKTNIGTLANLLTTDKSSLVAAVNELNKDLDTTLYNTEILQDALDVYLQNGTNVKNSGRFRINPDTTQRPPGLKYGFREINYYSTNGILVVVTELEPVYGRVWYNYYTSEIWQGWNCYVNKPESIPIAFQQNTYFNTPDTLKITKIGDCGYLYIRITSKSEIPAWTDVVIGNAAIVPREDIEANIVFDTGAAARVIFKTDKTVRITALSGKIISNSVARVCIPVAFN